jgi:hypothetical protein
MREVELVTRWTCRLLLFSATGFERNLMKSVAARSDVELIDLARIYGF